MIPIAQPIINKEEINAVTEVLKSCLIAQGPKVEEFEHAFAEYIGTEYAIAVSSGTSALHISLLANGIKKGDEVITTPFSFISTANSILFTGATPVFVDICEDTFNLNPECILEKITPKTKAILPVHLYGQSADMSAIMEIAEDHKLSVIEDACQAHGATYKNKKVGSFGTGCFSFYPTKNIATGEGGMITTNDQEINKSARMIRNHGSKERYLHEILGFNFRMTDIEAAIGIVQLKKLDTFNKIRQDNAKYLTYRLKDINGIIIPVIKNNTNHVFHQYTIRVTEEFGISRDQLVKILNQNGIGTGVYYQIPIHKQPFYQKLGYKDSLPVSEKVAKQVISLPIHPNIKKEDLDYICKTIYSYYEPYEIHRIL
ncbi:MAG TPA: DegT/DnrJ/EryC1/StrS family aminotransferase [Methanosarcinales archaeon]|nr:DegT/DnrJ/EryC1/StrS family aminotransferase [Methanosarcinales archaeon]